MRARLLALALLVVLAGCLSGGPAAPSPTPTDTATPTATPQSPTLAPPASGCARWVSFWGLEGPATRHWAPDRVLIGYTLTGNASVFFVASEGDTVLGTTRAETIGLDYGVTADGDEIPLDRSLSGEHEIRVTAHADANRNGVFDPDTDPPCRRDGAVVRTSARIDFDRFGPA